jgi:hypothetical protein
MRSSRRPGRAPSRIWKALVRLRRPGDPSAERGPASRSPAAAIPAPAPSRPACELWSASEHCHTCASRAPITLPFPPRSAIVTRVPNCSCGSSKNRASATASPCSSTRPSAIVNAVGEPATRRGSVCSSRPWRPDSEGRPRCARRGSSSGSAPHPRHSVQRQHHLPHVAQQRLEHPELGHLARDVRRPSELVNVVGHRRQRPPRLEQLRDQLPALGRRLQFLERGLDQQAPDRPPRSSAARARSRSRFASVSVICWYTGLGLGSMPAADVPAVPRRCRSSLRWRSPRRPPDARLRPAAHARRARNPAERPATGGVSRVGASAGQAGNHWITV